MTDYTIQEANQLTQMLKDLATIKSNHKSALGWQVDDAVKTITEIREFVIEMLSHEA